MLPMRQLPRLRQLHRQVVPRHHRESLQLKPMMNKKAVQPRLGPAANDELGETQALDPSIPLTGPGSTSAV